MMEGGTAEAGVNHGRMTMEGWQGGYCCSEKQSVELTNLLSMEASAGSLGH